MTADAFCIAAACGASLEDERLRPRSGGSPFCEQNAGNQDANGDDVIEGNVDPIATVSFGPCCRNNLQHHIASHFKRVPSVHHRNCTEAVVMPQLHLH